MNDLNNILYSKLLKIKEMILDKNLLVFGLCSSFSDTFDSIDQDFYFQRNVLSALMQTWPKYSGYKYYPVPSSRKKSTPKKCFEYHSNHKSLHKGKYGALRMELLDWLIEQTKINKDIKCTQVHFIELQSDCFPDCSTVVVEEIKASLVLTEAEVFVKNFNSVNALDRVQAPDWYMYAKIA